jgi:uncharacterized protein YcfJ
VQHRVIQPLLLIAAIAPAGVAMAQEGGVTVIQIENVRIDYARVLRVEPVYQTLTATRMEHQCETPSGKGLTRIVGAVKDALTPGTSDDAATATSEQDCRLVQVEREFKRPIAYDVDYVYKGSKYRSRLPRDPGSRLRVRVSVTPYPAGSGNR